MITECWGLCGRILVVCLWGFGIVLGFIWSMFLIYLGLFCVCLGLCLEYVWRMFGLRLGSVWDGFGM